MIVYVDNPNPKESTKINKLKTKNLLEEISEFSKIEGYKKHIRKSTLFPYTSNEHIDAEIKNNYFTIFEYL